MAQPVLVVPCEVVELLQHEGRDPVRGGARGVFHGLPFHSEHGGAGPRRRLEIEEPAALRVPEVLESEAHHFLRVLAPLRVPLCLERLDHRRGHPDVVLEEPRDPPDPVRPLVVHPRLGVPEVLPEESQGLQREAPAVLPPQVPPRVQVRDCVHRIPVRVHGTVHERRGALRPCGRELFETAPE